MHEPTRGYLETLFEVEHLLPRPDYGTYAEALLAVLRIGHVVVVGGNTSDSGEESFGGALAQLRELGWPLDEIVIKDEGGKPKSIGYTLKHPLVPPWTWVLPIPVIKMDVS